MAQLQYLASLDKPLLLALNKADQYSREELQILLARLRKKTGLDENDIVTVSTGGREQVVRLLGEEMEQRGDRPRRPEIAALRRAVQRQLDQDRELMESLRETAVLTLASEKLEAAQPLDLKKSLQIRDGLACQKLIEGHILQSIQANLDRFTSICSN